MLRLLPLPPAAAERSAPDRSDAPFRLYNIGNHTPVNLRDFVVVLERHLETTADIELAPIESGDVEATIADVDALAAAVDFAPKTPLDEGLGHFVTWFDRWRGRN